jgi:membrane protein YdbS with pleckstrin-like domain
MDGIGPLGLLLYAPLVLALAVGALLLSYGAKRKKYWVGIIGVVIILIFLSIYFYQ